MSITTESSAETQALLGMHRVFAKITGWEPLLLRNSVQPYPAYADHPLAGVTFDGPDYWSAIRDAFAAIDAAGVPAHRLRAKSKPRSCCTAAELGNGHAANCRNRVRSGRRHP